MARCSNVILFLSLSQVVLAMTCNSYLLDTNSSLSLPSKCESELKKVLYLHDIHPPRTDRNLIVSVQTSDPHGFGSITVNDWDLLDAPNSTGNLVATARGTGVNTDPANGFIYQNSFSILFGSGSSFPGSTLEVMGLNSVGQWAIVGGTGELTFARGVIKYDAIHSVVNYEYYQRISIYALYTPPSVTGNLFL